MQRAQKILISGASVLWEIDKWRIPPSTLTFRGSSLTKHVDVPFPSFYSFDDLQFTMNNPHAAAFRCLSIVYSFPMKGCDFPRPCLYKSCCTAEAHKLLEMVAKQTPPLNALIDAWCAVSLRRIMRYSYSGKVYNRNVMTYDGNHGMCMLLCHSCSYLFYLVLVDASHFVSLAFRQTIVALYWVIIGVI
jgi:hypothetical protein